MGACASAPGSGQGKGKHTRSGASACTKPSAQDNKLAFDVADEYEPDRVVQISPSGRLIPPATRPSLDVAHAPRSHKVVFAPDPSAPVETSDVKDAEAMGLHVRPGSSTAFQGLLVARVLTARLTELRNPLLQAACEDDKSKFIQHSTARAPQTPSGAPALSDQLAKLSLQSALTSSEPAPHQAAAAPDIASSVPSPRPAATATATSSLPTPVATAVPTPVATTVATGGAADHTGPDGSSGPPAAGSPMRHAATTPNLTAISLPGAIRMGHRALGSTESADGPGSPRGYIPSFQSDPGAGKERTFSWAAERLVFVVVYSQAELHLRLRDAGFTGGMGLAVAKLAVRNLPQGESEHELDVLLRGRRIGSLLLSINYRWLRGTQDTGQYVAKCQLSINPRKLSNFWDLVTHVSNVNHWLLSHDNVWVALEQNHPLLERIRSKQNLSQIAEEEGRNGAANLGRSTGSSVRGAAEGGTDGTEAGTVTTETGVDGSDDALTPMREGTRWLQVQREMEGRMDFEEDDLLQGSHEWSEVIEQLTRKCPAMDTRLMAMQEQMAAIMLHLNKRVSALETVVAAQTLTIRELKFQLEEQQGSGNVLPFISGRFGYGLGRPAARREVLLFTHRAQAPGEEQPKPVFLGKYLTDSTGKLGPIEVPEEVVMQPGYYHTMALLPKDNTFAQGTLYVLKPATPLVVFDIDGTLTVGDEQVVTQFALNAVAASTDVGDRMLTQAYDQKARAHARTLVRLWAAKGYQPIYLSGRPGSFYNLTLQWLIKHNYPPGPIHLTRTHTPTLPVYASVGNFKVQYLKELQRKGLRLYAAYGNTGTDARAYATAGIPKDRIFTIGQGAGALDTVAVRNWTDHLRHVLSFPDASPAHPAVDILFNSTPQYHHPSRIKFPPSRPGKGGSGSRDARPSGSLVDGTYTASVASAASWGSEAGVDSLVSDDSTHGQRGDTAALDTDNQDVDDGDSEPLNDAEAQSPRHQGRS